MDELANLHYLEQVLPNNWWTLVLRSSTEKRIEAIRRLKSIPVNPELCNICRAVDWEYLIFGSENTGFKKAHSETLCLGPRSTLQQRADSRCPFCANIVTTLLGGIDEWHKDPRTENGCVHLDVSESNTQLAAPTDHKSYLLKISVRPPGLTNHTVGKVCNDEDTPHIERGFASTISSVLIDNDLSAFRSLPEFVNYSRCRGWLQTCFDQHESCNVVHTRDEDSPIKLIDVVERNVVSFSRKGNIEYVALSYVRGPGYSLCVLQGSDNWSKDAQGNSIHPLPDKMPATLEDATAAAKALDIRYLWVDSICIAQDDEDEKQAQIGRMYRIYNDATVCIVSAASLDSNTSLSGVSASRIHLTSQKAKIKDDLYLGLPFSNLGSVLAKYRYMGRAWTYQELLLSKRTLFFTAEEVFYYCAQSTFRESRFEHQGEDPEAETWASLSPESKSHLIGNVVTMRKTKDPAELCRLFQAAAQEYSSRVLSYQEDAVNAFYGILTLFEQLFGGKSINGCPESMLLNCLTWRDPRINTPAPELAKRRMNTRNPDFAVYPSWVWCSYAGTMNMTSIPYCYTQSVCHIYRPPFSGNDLQRLFPNTRTGVCCSCSLREHQIKVQYCTPLLTRTKTITLPVIAEGDEGMMPGQADLSTTDDQHLGSSDFRGQCSLDEVNGSEVTFMQLYAADSNQKYPHVTVLMLRTCKLQDSLSKINEPEFRYHILSLAKPSRRLPQTATEPPLSDTAGHMTFKKSLVQAGCPEILQINDTELPNATDILVGARIGIAYISHKQWMKMQPQDTLVFLI